MLKVQPLGGVRAALDDLPYACGLATATLLPADVTSAPLVPDARGVLAVRRVEPDRDLLARYAEAIT